MLKRDIIIQQLTANGYDDALAAELPKAFISDFFDKELEKLSEELDIFIDEVHSGRILPDANNNVVFRGILKMEESDMTGKSVSGIFYDFCSKIIEDFNYIVKRQPLQKILLSGGAMVYHPELECISYNPVVFEKDIVGSPAENSDLCCVGNKYYVKADDLYTLISSKGFNREVFSVIFGLYGCGPRYPKEVPEEGIYFNYNAVMALGNNDTYSRE